MRARPAAVAAVALALVAAVGCEPAPDRRLPPAQQRAALAVAWADSTPSERTTMCDQAAWMADRLSDPDGDPSFTYDVVAAWLDAHCPPPPEGAP